MCKGIFTHKKWRLNDAYVCVCVCIEEKQGENTEPFDSLTQRRINRLIGKISGRKFARALEFNYGNEYR